MSYTKPQVVIDLEEYNDLLKIKNQKESVTEEERALITGMLLNTVGSLENTKKEIRRHFSVVVEEQHDNRIGCNKITLLKIN